MLSSSLCSCWSGAWPTRKGKIGHFLPLCSRSKFKGILARKASTCELDTLGIPLIYSPSYCASELKPTWPSQKAALSSSPLSSLTSWRSLYKFHESFEPYIFSLSSRFARHVLLKYDNFTRRSLLHPRPSFFFFSSSPCTAARHPGGFPFPLFHGVSSPRFSILRANRNGTASRGNAFFLV